MGVPNCQWLFDLGEKIIVDCYAISSPLFVNSPTTSHALLKQQRLDLRYYSRRCANEGLKFLTTTMPLYGKWLDGILGTKELPPPVGFEPYSANGHPLFLHTIVERATADCGDEMIAVQARVLRALRTLCYLCYKLEVPYSREQESMMLKKFITVDESLEDDGTFYAAELEYVRLFLTELLGTFSWRDAYGRVVQGFRPRHGPGAVATGQKLEQKWRWKHLYASLHQRFPYYEFMYGVTENGKPKMLERCVWEYKNMLRIPEPTAKLVMVPKDSRGPRLISTEPLEVQFIQQGLSSMLVDYLEGKYTSGCRCPYIGQINFADQGVNSRLALDNSVSGEMATLDLSDASDRVSLQVIKQVFPPEMVKDLLAARSTATQLPEWFATQEGIPQVCRLKKFAPMGSAMCFPIESMFFWAVCATAVYLNGENRGIEAMDRAAQSVYIYGDDIVVPTVHAESVSRMLELFDLRVNTSKSYWKGNFRESCGTDAYKGHLVTPIRLKKLPPVNVRQGTEAQAYAAYATSLWEVGLSSASDHIVDRLRSIFGFVPFVNYEQSYLCVIRPGYSEDVSGYPSYTPGAFGAYPTARAWALRPTKRAVRLGSWPQ